MEQGEIELRRFDDLLCRVRKGCWEAIADLHVRYFSSSLRLAERYLQNGEERLIDAEMAVDSALGTLIRRFQRGAHEQLDSEREFWQLLARVVQRKLTKYRRYQYAQRRDPGHPPLPVDRLASGETPAGVSEPWATATDSPLAQAIADETLDVLLERLRNVGSREVLLLRLEGFSELQIAERLCRSRGWVQRRNREIRRVAQSYLQEAC